MAKAAKQAAAKASPSTPKAAGRAAKSPKGAEKATKSVEKTANASKLAEKQASTSKVPLPKAVEEAEDDDDEEDEDFVDGEDGSDENVSGGDAGSDDDEESDSDDEGVDEEGMERLMKLLGDDGLDEYDQAQLNTMLGGDDESGSEEEGEEEEGEDDSDEEADSDSEEAAAGPSATKPQEADDDAIPLDEVEDEVDEDAVPQRKLEIDNTVALERIRDTIQLDPSLPWTETLVLSYPNTIDVDVEDDLNRELAFYKQALHGANAARALAAKHNFPFTRPADYFAEMVKSDAHMERIRQRLLDEKATIKKSEDKRREREGKKFGKQVQIEKLKEREQSKKDMEERLRSLKRKHKDVLDKPVDDDFDVAVEDAIADRPAKRGKPNGPKMARSARDKKFGYGTVGRRAKQNTKESTDNFDFGGGKGGKGGPAKGGKKGFKPQRPGKSRRHAMKR
ncbi:eukaryotic rRNA processing protein EBP2-domain-containing protein [Schizophyllum commune]